MQFWWNGSEYKPYWSTLKSKLEVRNWIHKVELNPSERIAMNMNVCVISMNMYKIKSYQYLKGVGKGNRDN